MSNPMSNPNACMKPNCGRPVWSRERCGRHYQYDRRHGLLPAQPSNAEAYESHVWRIVTNKRWATT